MLKTTRTFTHVNQGILETALNSIFSASGIKNARRKVSIKYPLSGKFLEVDVWYPALKLCFEYQDDYHYQPTWYHQHSLSVVQEKDNIKRDLLLQRGESLIQIPCWWDGSSTNLQATINFHRPDLFPDPLHKNCCIPPNPSFNFFSDVQLMLASFPSSPDLIDVREENSWWMGEKYDGVRCFWNSMEKQLYSRHGVQIYMYPPVTLALGPVSLDGEIWCGRGFFQESKFLVQASVHKTNWALFRLVCFDEASHAMIDQPFEQRYAFVLAHFNSEHSFVILATRVMCASNDLLVQNLRQVVEEGGEGVILRKPLSRYQPGRSPDLIKLKDYREDQEALVMEVEENGSLLLQLTNGRFVHVPKANCVLPRRPVSGDIVSFKFELGDSVLSDKNENKIGSNISVFRIRDDLSWEDVLNSSSLAASYFLNERFQSLANTQPKPPENQKMERKNMRTRLECLAREKGLDPLSADAWYSVPSFEFTQHSVVRQFIQKHYSNSWTTALENLFPDLKLDISKFKHLKVPLQERKSFFDNFAKAQGFDPLVSDNWYAVSMRSFLKHKEFAEILKYYNVLSNCLLHLYPNIGLQKSKFTTLVPDRKSFFDEFAKSQGFDPLDPENWYSVSTQSLSKHQKYNEIMKYYTNLSECLMHLYPNIGLQKSKFSTIPIRDRKMFFDNFAKAQGFDPLIPDNWYFVSIQSLSNHKIYKTISSYYNSLLACLMHIYPSIGLSKSKFENTPERRVFFDKLAAAQGFDPLVPDNWHNVSFPSLSKYWGYKLILPYYKNNVADCLLHLYPNIGLQKTKSWVHHSQSKQA